MQAGERFVKHPAFAVGAVDDPQADAQVLHDGTASIHWRPQPTCQHVDLVGTFNADRRIQAILQPETEA